MNAIEITLATQADTRQLAEQLAMQAAAGTVITLSGEVGAGKTTFAQYFISSLLSNPQIITSPTFTITQYYDSAKGVPILHADLYRLKEAGELVEIGLEDAFENHVCLIEWPKVARDILPKNSIHISLYHEQGDSRRASLYSDNSTWNIAL